MILILPTVDVEVRPLMWIRHIFLGLVGLTAGAAVAGGTFAFLIMLNIIPRMIGKSRRQEGFIYMKI